MIRIAKLSYINVKMSNVKILSVTVFKVMGQKLSEFLVLLFLWLRIVMDFIVGLKSVLWLFFQIFATIVVVKCEGRYGQRL